nr:unnamed protein product [Spirometra erinaceieuropaei]
MILAAATITPSSSCETAPNTAFFSRHLLSPSDAGDDNLDAPTIAVLVPAGLRYRPEARSTGRAGGQGYLRSRRLNRPLSLHLEDEAPTAISQETPCFNTQPPPLPTISADALGTSRTYCTSSYELQQSADTTGCSPSKSALCPSSTINTDSACEPPLTSSSSSAVAAPARTTTAHNPDAPTNTNLPTVNTSDVDSIHTCPHCDRTSHIGLVVHLRIRLTETSEPMSGAPNCARRIFLHYPHCPRTVTHCVGLFGHIRTHESGIDRCLDTPNTS